MPHVRVLLLAGQHFNQCAGVLAAWAPKQQTIAYTPA
jgi:hypothetical protein